MEIDSKAKVEVINKGLGGGFNITLDHSKNWCASTNNGVAIGWDGFQTGISSQGETMDDAVNNLWKILTELPEGHVIVLHDKTGRHELHWNGLTFVQS